jgi:hypothetical protein
MTTCCRLRPFVEKDQRRGQEQAAVGMHVRQNWNWGREVAAVIAAEHTKLEDRNQRHFHTRQLTDAPPGEAMTCVFIE